MAFFNSLYSSSSYIEDDLLIPIFLFIAVVLVFVGVARRKDVPSLHHQNGPAAALIIVFGDLERSPRMRYHAQSFEKHKDRFNLDVIAFSSASNSSSSSWIYTTGAASNDTGNDNDTDFSVGKASTSKTNYYYLPIPRKITTKNRFFYILQGLWRLVWQCLALLYIILFTLKRSPNLILIQNPPAIPTLFMARLACLLLHLKCSLMSLFLLASPFGHLNGQNKIPKLIIDWHNFGYSIMALERGGNDDFIVRVARWYEKALATSCDWSLSNLLLLPFSTIFGKNGMFATTTKDTAHLTVTKAMAKELQKVWGVGGEIVTLYDRPPQSFRIFSLDEKLDFLSRLQISESNEVFIARKSQIHTTRNLRSSKASLGSISSLKGIESIFTFVNPSTGKLSFKDDAPTLLVSSTSWTVDEDFSILLDALVKYDTQLRKKGSKQKLPSICCIITGKGPLKSHFMSLMKESNLKCVSIYSAWLAIDDYPKLLACASLGVSLHTSSSGLDLPMKVVDMFGAGIPALALDFNCLSELVRNGENGYAFKNADELSSRLFSLLAGYSLTEIEEGPGLKHLREGVLEFKRNGWDQNWDSVMLPLIDKLSP